MFLKTYTLKFSCVFILGIDSLLRDSNVRNNARYKATALEMKSDPTLFLKTVSKGRLEGLHY